MAKSFMSSTVSSRVCLSYYKNMKLCNLPFYCPDCYLFISDTVFKVQFSFLSPEHIVITPHEIVWKSAAVQFKHPHHRIFQVNLWFFR